MSNVQRGPTVSPHAGVSAVRIDPETRAGISLSDEQGSVAVAAAGSVFAASGITADQAAQAVFDLESWDLDGFPQPDPTDEQYAEARVWGEARHAAQTALAARWPDLDVTWVALELNAA